MFIFPEKKRRDELLIWKPSRILGNFYQLRAIFYRLHSEFTGTCHIIGGGIYLPIPYPLLPPLAAPMHTSRFITPEWN